MKSRKLIAINVLFLIVFLVIVVAGVQKSQINKVESAKIEEEDSTLDEIPAPSTTTLTLAEPVIKTLDLHYRAKNGEEWIKKKQFTVNADVEMEEEVEEVVPEEIESVSSETETVETPTSFSNNHYQSERTYQQSSTNSSKENSGNTPEKNAAEENSQIKTDESTSESDEKNESDSKEEANEESQDQAPEKDTGTEDKEETEQPAKPPIEEPENNPEDGKPVDPPKPTEPKENK
ncbi:hypothetical protein GLW20_09945 [Virgibacillus halodenitrificans]|nr:hypothetical protein [Virgibacillus halodenitrificans]